MNIKKLPKIELHCHLDGSIRPSTILDIIKKDNLNIKCRNIQSILPQISIIGECKNLDEYLTKFHIPNLVMQSYENLKRISYELVEDAALDNVKYIEIRFAPLLHMEKGLSFDEIVESILSGMKEAEKKYDIHSNLILGCMRHMSTQKAMYVVEEGRKFLNKGVIAVDLCGGEPIHFCEKFVEPMKLAKKYGYRITIHAGETGYGVNVLEGINLLGAERIGHGIFTKNCDDAYKLLMKKNISLEMCPTSNLHTKAFKSYSVHPFKEYFNDGIKVTLNTDNMTVSNTTLTNEIENISKFQNISLDDYKTIYLNSVNASFASEDIKSKLKSLIKSF